MRSEFFTAQTINLCLGWWGVISFFLTPILILMNFANYFGARYELRAPDPSGARAPARPSMAPANGCPRCGIHPDVVYALGRTKCKRCNTVFV